MFFLKKKRNLCAVCDGRVMPLSEMPDEAFSSGILGIGYAIEPHSDRICSPVCGVVDSVAEAKHAYTIQSEDGLDILVHIGVDTVGLKGDGFLPLVKAGDRVRTGEPIAKVDYDVIRAHKLCTYTAVLIGNPACAENMEYQYGEAKQGDPVVRFRLAGKE